MPEKRKWTAADCMPEEPRGSFRYWIIEQHEREDATGRFSKSVVKDKCLGQRRTPNAILIHLQARHWDPDANEADIADFIAALNEWKAEGNF